MPLEKWMHAQDGGQTCLLIYDGECQLCVSTKQKLERAGVGQTGSDIRFLPYQSDEAKQVLGENYRSGRPDMAFLVRPSGEVCQGLDAFLPLLPRLPGGQSLLWCLRIPFLRRLAVWGYRLVARYRYHLFGEAAFFRSQG
jgi:predicted DCC family thiol-disulfide oxidoreductase YuxK